MSTPDMTTPERIASLASRIVNRYKPKSQPPFVLFLGSDAMPLRAIEDSVLRADGLDDAAIGRLTQLGRAGRFTSAWRALRGDDNQLAEIIASAVGTANSDPGYAALARLIAAGYFGVIFTADITARLEDALGHEAAADRWRSYSAPRYSVEELRWLLNRSFLRVKIIKLAGDLADQFAFEPDEVRQSLAPLGEAGGLLSQYLGLPVLVVGHNQERDQWPFQPVRGELHYVAATEPLPGSNAFIAITSRPDGDRNLLTGPEAAFDAFWPELEQAINKLIEFNKIVPVSDLSVEAAEKVVQSVAAKREITQIVEILDELHDDTLSRILLPKLIYFRLEFDADRRLAFKAEDGLTYQSRENPILSRLDPEGLNSTLQFMGNSIAAYHRQRDEAGRKTWREQAKYEGRKLYREMLEGNGELMEKLGTARHIARDGENLFLNFVGPRHYLGMPYELLADDKGPLAVRHPIYRRIVGVDNPRAQSFDKLLSGLQRARQPLRILFIAANTGGLDALGEAQALEKQIKDQADALKIKTQIDIVPPHEATLDRVRKLLDKCSYHLVHFAGHGDFDKTTGENSGLVVWKDDAAQDRVVMTARELAQRLRDSQVQLFYLNVCLGATVGGEHLLRANDYLGVMDALVQADVPIVLGYRWYVTDGGAKRFSSAFYRALFETHSAPQAALAARRQLYERDATDETWTSPILVDQTA